MRPKKTEYLKQLIGTENEQLNKLHAIVSQAVKEEQLITNKLSDDQNEKISFKEKLADKVASFGGSWTFIIAFFILFFTWIAINSIQFMAQPFDPYPFILMNLVLSLIAALQAPIIMMSQNRQEQKDRKRSENDYIINLKAEIEIRNLHQKIDLLMADQFKSLIEIQKVQITMMEEMNTKLNVHLNKTK